MVDERQIFKRKYRCGCSLSEVDLKVDLPLTLIPHWWMGAEIQPAANLATSFKVWVDLTLA